MSVGVTVFCSEHWSDLKHSVKWRIKRADIGEWRRDRGKGVEKRSHYCIKLLWTWHPSLHWTDLSSPPHAQAICLYSWGDWARQAGCTVTKWKSEMRRNRKKRGLVRKRVIECERERVRVRERERQCVCAWERERERERERETVCVCVCVRERERERQCVCVWERERERDRVCVCVCVWERERDTVCVCERERERERETVCVCVWERKRERETVCVWERERFRERDSVCVWERELERERGIDIVLEIQLLLSRQRKCSERTWHQVGVLPGRSSWVWTRWILPLKHLRLAWVCESVDG